MGCPLNKKKFLGFSYEGRHDYQITVVVPSLTQYRVLFECSKCAECYASNASISSLIRDGFDKDKLLNMPERGQLAKHLK